MKMDEQQWKELARERGQWRRDQWLRAIIENFPLFWIFDSQLHEIYRTKVRETAQEYRRMKIRYFFSWEGLSKFLLAPVFKVGLTSILVTPFIASIYISLRGVLSPLFHYSFPSQMGLLFFSGAFVVIARIFYEGFCPRLVKAHINSSTLDTQHLQNTEWLQTELEYCLLHYVDKLRMDKDYVRGKQIREMQRKWREGPRAEDDPPGYSSIVPELAEHRVGFGKYGVWLIENLLLRIAIEKNRKLFTSWGLPQKFRECEHPEAAWDTHYTALHFVVFKVAYADTEEQKITQGDLLLEIYETNHTVVDDFPKHASIHNYFHGAHQITNLGANKIVKEFIAENENYWRPWRRIAIAVVLSVSIFLLLWFFVIQTLTVWKAIFS
jgi:hypothetical protein